MPKVHLTIHDDNTVTILDGPQDNQDDEGCDACQDESVDPDYAAAVNLAQAAQFLRIALDHVSDDEVRALATETERLVAVYLAAV